jgi:hypothetical protein
MATKLQLQKLGTHSLGGFVFLGSTFEPAKLTLFAAPTPNSLTPLTLTQALILLNLAA